MTITKNLKRLGIASGTLMGLSGLLLGNVSALKTTASSRTSSSSSTTLTADQQARLATIKTKGDQEITRRITKLNQLSAKISSATKLTHDDAVTLNGQVNDELNGPNSLSVLKTKLDGETTLAGAITDAKSIYTGYRVYALVMPKVNLVKTADDEQVTAGKLLAMGSSTSSPVGPLVSALNSAKAGGKDVTALQAKLADLNSKAGAAQNIAKSIETGIINLQPTDYNANHQVLSGDRDQLKTAHADNLAAFADAKAIVAGLKS